ncbi:MAG: hypothetical protein WC666_04330 [Candidatus Paceibacterota bacterium]
MIQCQKISEVVIELREQIEEITDPVNPEKLRGYVLALRDGIDKVVPMLSEDPTMAATALYNQIQFKNNTEVFNVIIERDIVEGQDWPSIKPLITVRSGAKKAIKVLEQAGLERVLVIAVIANFELKNRRRVQDEMLKEKEEFQDVE